MDIKEVEQKVQNLILKYITLDDLKNEIDSIKDHINSLDKKLVGKLSERYNQAREFQNNCTAILECTKQNEFSDEGFRVINEILFNAKDLNVEFPELTKLEEVKNIKPWLKSIFLNLLSKKKTENA